MSEHKILWECPCGEVNKSHDWRIVTTAGVEPFGPDYYTDTVIVDCPRCGMDRKVLKRRRDMGGVRYPGISCLVDNSATELHLARLYEGYDE
jgi:tRNA/tmRNA/rRNA uracil-C5-methylase (TrmA/RlmC/RlmD family)